MRGYFRPPEIDTGDGYQVVVPGRQSLPRGCCVAILAPVVLVAGLISYLEIGDRLAVRAAKNRCTPNDVLQVRQPNVWATYLRQLPPTEPYGDFLRARNQIRSSMAMTMKSQTEDYDNVLVLSDARGEVARLRYVSAATWFTIEGPHALLFSCLQKSPALYSKSYAF